MNPKMFRVKAAIVALAAISMLYGARGSSQESDAMTATW